jgi:hypothetical protein
VQDFSNLNVAYEAIWLSLLMGISLAFTNVKSTKRIVLFMLLFLYFATTWVMHWSRALTLSSGVLLALSPLVLRKIRSMRRRVATSVVISGMLLGGYILFAPQILTNIFWVEEGTQAGVEQKLVENVVKDEVRVRLFRATVDLWEESPIWGVGFFRSGEIILGREGGGPHSGLLILLAEGGLLAVVIFLIGLRDLIIRTKPWIALPVRGEGELRNLVFLGTLSLLPRMMFDGVFYNTAMLPILIITGYRIRELTQAISLKHISGGYYIG